MKRVGGGRRPRKMEHKNDVDIIAIQEARMHKNRRESRGDYTWYFSGKTSTVNNGRQEQISSLKEVYEIYRYHHTNH